MIRALLVLAFATFAVTSANALTYPVGFRGLAGNLMIDGQMITTVGTFSATVPFGVTSITEEAWGGGGSGADRSGAYGGGSGAYAEKTSRAVTPGTVFSFTIGAGGAGTTATTGKTGSSTTLDGMTAGGGVGGKSTAGTGGSASGGTTNTNGNSSTGLTGATAPGTGGGAGGTGDGTTTAGPGGAPGGGGCGRNSGAGGSGAGGSGGVRFSW